ncbi:hypothetical protein JOF41_004090 [Saccharothrix coeruleofusca]|uniref:hypothetical protein n=1 Tax=Saccharothrix coeruleofusca TaxID=33919 RepID=UPI001AE1C6B3|nr:hypothetical protein [Saccharothrix coeruleofusca]MBP2337912.1 hypothetical protein [Saccharothrix coeruleofusca]
MTRWVLLVSALLLSAGCAAPVAGKPVAAPVTSSAAAAAPDEVVRWVDKFCGVANYLIAAGSVSAGQPTGDPARMKQAMSESLGRVVDVLDVALHDLAELSPAPDPAADTSVELITTPLAEARDKFAAAREAVDNAPELTGEVFEGVMKNMTEAVTGMTQGVEKLAVVSLPEQFQRAVPQAPNCAQR